MFMGQYWMDCSYKCLLEQHVTWWFDRKSRRFGVNPSLVFFISPPCIVNVATTSDVWSCSRGINISYLRSRHINIGIPFVRSNKYLLERAVLANICLNSSFSIIPHTRRLNFQPHTSFSNVSFKLWFQLQNSTLKLNFKLQIPTLNSTFNSNFIYNL